MKIVFMLGVIFMILGGMMAFAFIISSFETNRNKVNKPYVFIMSVFIVIGGLSILCASNAPRLSDYYEDDKVGYEDIFPESYNKGREEFLESITSIEKDGSKVTIIDNNGDAWVLYDISIDIK